MLTQLGPSIIRTIVPILVQIVVAQAARVNLDLGQYEGLVSEAVGAVVATAYYAGARWLETRLGPVWGRLLGSTKTPTYEAPAAPSEESPTGAVATEDTPGVSEGEPVAVVPVDEDGDLPDPGAWEDPEVFEPDPSVGDGTSAVVSVKEAIDDAAGKSLPNDTRGH